MMTPNYTKQQLIQETALSDADIAQVQQCRRDHNRLGFAYQLGCVRLLNRFPAQLPFEILEEVLAYISTQVALPAVLIIAYQQRQQTISEHQQHIAAYLGLKPFDSAEAVLLAQFIFEEACRLEQAAALQAHVKAFLKAQRILQPAESTLDGLIGEQRQRARRSTSDLLPPYRLGWPGCWKDCCRFPSARKPPHCSGSKPTRTVLRPTRCWCCSRRSSLLRQLAYYSSTCRGSTATTSGRCFTT
jgi:Domain of unknown function (DUF4158)